MKRKVSTARLIRAVAQAADQVIDAHIVVRFRLLLEEPGHQIEEKASTCSCGPCQKFLRLRKALIRRAKY